MTTTTTTAAIAATSFSPFHWYIDNSARLNDEVAADAGIPAAQVSWMAMNIIFADTYPSIALPLPEFEARFKQLVLDAALRTKALRAAADAEDAAAKLAEDIGVTSPRRRSTSASAARSSRTSRPRAPSRPRPLSASCPCGAPPPPPPPSECGWRDYDHY